MIISVVIATYNRRDVLARTLPTLFAQSFPAGDYEIVIVVDGSTDGTVEMLRNLKPPCALRVMEQPNRGPAIARNEGVLAARGKFLLLLDDDILCERELLREHVLAHAGSDNLVVHGPLFVARESPTTLASICTSEWYERFYRQLASDIESNQPRKYCQIINSSMKRSTFLAAGGFDADIPFPREDVELGIRMHERGVPFRLQPSAIAYELYSKSSRDFVNLDARGFGGAEVIVCRKHPNYRPDSALGSLGGGTIRNRCLREFILRLPFSPDWLLRVPISMAERFCSVPAIRRSGIRLMLLRHRVVLLRSALAMEGSRKALRREFGMRLPVLIYHHVGPPRPGIAPHLTIPPKQFERQVRSLFRHGYTGIVPSDWVAWRQGGVPLPDKPVLLTFDDGYADVADYALPVLRSVGFRAAVFVVTGQLGGTPAWDAPNQPSSPGLMSASQILEWSRQGMEFGAHSRTHADLNKLVASELEEEIAGSARDLAAITCTPVSSFAYPYGHYNEMVREHVESVFRIAFTAREGLNVLQTDPLLLRRTMVHPNDTLLDLECRVRFGYSPARNVRGHLRLRSRMRSGMQWLRR